MKMILIALLIAIPFMSFGKKYKDIDNPMFLYCYDGDTCTFNIKGYPNIIGHEISVRVRGIDTPEIRGKCSKEKTLALKGKEFINKRLSNALKIELRNIKRGKYFRIVADIYVDEYNISSVMIKRKLGRYYEGGRRKGWCK